MPRTAAWVMPHGMRPSLYVCACVCVCASARECVRELHVCGWESVACVFGGLLASVCSVRPLSAAARAEACAYGAD